MKANLRLQHRPNNAYVLIVSQIKQDVFRIKQVECIPSIKNTINCPVSNENLYIIIDFKTIEGCGMKLEDRSRQLFKILSDLAINQYPWSEYNFTCVIKSIDDIPKPDDNNPYAKTSLISVVFLSTCAALTFALCFGWFICSYYRRFKQRRIKIQLKKAMENSVQKFLKESPVITFNSKIKAQHFTDDDPMCAICLESFKDNDKIRKLKCSHYFHIQCIDPWLLAHQNCPLCNQNILTNSIPSISARMTITNDETTDAPVVT